MKSVVSVNTDNETIGTERNKRRQRGCRRLGFNPFVLGFVAHLGLGIVLAAGTVAGQDRGRGTAYLGAFLGDVTEERVRELKLTELRGAVVGRVVPESPAEKAGLQEGDVIVRFRSEPVEGREHFFRLLGETRPGTIVTLGISRGGTVTNVHITLGERRGPLQDSRRRMFAEADETRAAGERFAQEAEAARQKGDEKEAQELAEVSAQLLKQSEELRAEIEKLLEARDAAGQSDPRPSNYSLGPNRHLLGASVVPLSEQLAAYFNVPGSGGVLVAEVRPGGLIERAGIRVGDCITAVNGDRIYSVQDLSRQVQRLSRAEGAAQKPESVFAVVRDRREIEVRTEIGGR